MQKKLKDLAKIFSGYSFRGSIESDLRGDILVLQAKNIAANKDITSTENLMPISGRGIRNPYFLKNGDITIVAKGSGRGAFKAAIFTANDSKVMPSSSVCVISLKDEVVLAQYVCLFLNSEVGQRALEQIAIGGSQIRNLAVKSLAELEIPVPSMDKQKSLIALAENIKEQEELIMRKKEINKTLFNATFKNLINT